MPCHSLSGQDTQGKLHFTRSYRRSSSNSVKNGIPIKLKPKTSFDISGNNGSNFICPKKWQFSSLRNAFWLVVVFVSAPKKRLKEAYPLIQFASWRSAFFDISEAFALKYRFWRIQTAAWALSKHSVMALEIWISQKIGRQPHQGSAISSVSEV